MRDSAPHILVVDDDPAVVEALTAALKGTYVVHGAATGKAACAILRAHPVAAIILDAVLGAEHGLDLVQHFRALSRAPILMLTGHGSEELAIQALRVKVDDYLRKPVNVEDLGATLARLVQEHARVLEPVEHTRRYLAEHLAEPHTVAALAQAAGMSERQLYREFREAFGMTPRRYLTRLRLEQAAELLRTTDLGADWIARDVGYPSFSTFCRLFKRAFGLTPSEWRAQSAQAEPGTSALHEDDHGDQL
jgi:YesN/AraC family two-component response regulator